MYVQQWREGSELYININRKSSSFVSNRTFRLLSVIAEEEIFPRHVKKGKELHVMG